MYVFIRTIGDRLFFRLLARVIVLLKNGIIKFHFVTTAMFFRTNSTNNEALYLFLISPLVRGGMEFFCVEI